MRPHLNSQPNSTRQPFERSKFKRADEQHEALSQSGRHPYRLWPGLLNLKIKALFRERARRLAHHD